MAMSSQSFPGHNLPRQRAYSGVGLRPWSDEDLELLRQLMGTWEMTEHLGGPESDEKIRERHNRYCASSRTGDGPMFVILVDGESAGSIGYWPREWNGKNILECGWSVLPGFQGRGIATAATRALLRHLRESGEGRDVHAFPSVENPASSAICKNAGFTLLGEVDFEYPPGHPMRCFDWMQKGRTDMSSKVSRIPAADANTAADHFARLLAFETDCSDVNHAIVNGTKDFVLLDVRSEKLYADGHVPGSVSLPHWKITAEALASYPADTLFVVYCAGPHCNGADNAALKLAKLGRSVKKMIGGVTGWTDEGLSLVH